jgi:septal ring factor EnvC (AmiA/AmiB activator)
MAKTKNKFDWLKKNIVIVPVVGAILAGTVTSVRYVFTMTDTIQVNKEILEQVTKDIEIQKEVLSDIKNRLARAEATWDMAENIFQQLADQVRQHEYDIKEHTQKLDNMNTSLALVLNHKTKH